MAGWSILADGSALDCIEILRYIQSNGFCLNLDFSLKGGVDGGKDTFRCLFNQILSLFLKEILESEHIRPLPAMLGDGRCVDLFKLFLVVREKGGYDLVSKNGLWASVAEESGLGLESVASVKLIYTKYLDTLDGWLQRTHIDKGIGGGLSHCGGNWGLLPVELESEFKVLLSGMMDQKKKDEERPSWDSEKTVHCLDQQKNDEECPRWDTEKTEHCLPDTEKMYDTHHIVSVAHMDGGKKYLDDDVEIEILGPNVINVDAYSHKRKRESLSGMLNWVTEIAKNPGGLATGISPEWSNWKVNGVKEFCRQALLAREVLLLRRHVYQNAEMSLLQKRQKMHPSMYEDHISADHQFTERLRCSQRILSLKKSRSRSPFEPSLATQSELDMSRTPCMAGLENHHDKRSFVTVDSLIESIANDHLQKRISVGPLFQADVPDWMGMALESDSKWLGTQVWPLVMANRSLLIEREPIGRGRQDSCGCPLPGSVECVRFHIAEKRMRLKLELGPAFYHWKIDHMGEEVSLSWTAAEEEKFKAVVRLNPPSLDNCFWEQVFKCFPSKSRKNLVSYYFNVFLLRHRSYQNRVTPNNIDSDDDEWEFVSGNNGFGDEVVKFPPSKSIFCAQNKQCIDLEEYTNVD